MFVKRVHFATQTCIVRNNEEMNVFIFVTNNLVANVCQACSGVLGDCK